MNNNNSTTQLRLSYFDQLFSDNPGDVMFCSLNDIEPIFMDPEALLDNEFSQPLTIDPRNELPITQAVYDYTVCSKPDLFKSANRSRLSKKEHSICLAFLQARKAKKQIFPHQLQCFEETSLKRQEEKNTFMQFLLQYNNANYDQIYAPSTVFVKLYQRLYHWEAQRVMKNHYDGIFQIHTGFPIPRLCGNSETYGSICDVEEVSRSDVPRLMDSNVDLTKMRSSIENCFELYTSCGETDERRDEKIDASGQQVQFEISTEALVFLLCAGEYVDIPTEVLVKVAMGNNGESVIHINEPLPSRNAGVHTSESVVSKCSEVFLVQGENKEVEQIQGSGFNGAYLLQTIEDYMEKFKCGPRSKCNLRGFNQVKWNLSLIDKERNIQILTRMKSGYSNGQGSSQVFPSIKMEYKPQFGCEVPSKFCLLREWIEQRLSASPHTSTNRHRINARTFETILHENLSVEDLEQELEKHYHVKIPRLLGSLGDFLSLLSKVSPGRYLLKFNPRFQDKLMLYAETKDATSKSCVTLHGLLQESPSDMAFMTLRQLTPIDDSLCSAMHDFYQVLPCAFPPWRTKVAHKIIDDRDFILKKVQEKTNLQAEKKNKQLQKRRQVKRLKRNKKLKLNAKQKKEEQKDVQELEEDIKHDQLLYGYGGLEAD